MSLVSASLVLRDFSKPTRVAVRADFVPREKKPHRFTRQAAKIARQLNIVQRDQHALPEVTVLAQATSANYNANQKAARWLRTLPQIAKGDFFALSLQKTKVARGEGLQQESGGRGVEII